MTELEKIINTKKTENGDVSYKTTGNNLVDLLFLTSYFEKHLHEVNIGQSEKEKLLAMFIRDPRYGLGRRDLGRRLMMYAGVSASDIVLAGRFDDLWNIPTKDNLDYLYNELLKGNELAKKWMPRLSSKSKSQYAKALCREWNIERYDYRKLVKCHSTVEYKLSYSEEDKNVDELDKLFKKKYIHPLVETIEFEKVPSMAMKRYLKTFSTKEGLKNRFAEYIKSVKEGKTKVNTSTSDVYEAYKMVKKNANSENSNVIAKKIIENETLGIELNAICILDTSGSMGLLGRGGLIDKATSVAHALSTHSTFAPNKVISFSSNPHLMAITGETLQEQYRSLYTGDCSNTDFGKVMELLRKLGKYPEYLIVLSDMEFDYGSKQSKEETMKIFKEHNANTKIIWWNFNDRNKTVPEFDEYGNIYLSGYNLQILKLLENKFDMTTYVDKILEDYKKKIGK